MDKKLALLSGITVFSLLFLAYSYFSLPQQEMQASCGCKNYIPQELVFPLVVFVALLLATIVLFFVSNRVKTTERRSALGSKRMIGMLSDEEKSCLKRISKKGGKMTQSELARELNLDKVKAHRLVKGLEEKGFVSKTAQKNTNEILLEEDVLESMKNEE